MKKMAGVVLVAIALICMNIGVHEKTVEAQSVSSHNVRYETGLLWAQQYEAIVGEIVNYDSISHNYRIAIYQQLISTPIFDSGTLPVAGGGTMTNGAYTVPANNVSNFLVEITVDSEKMVPSVSIGVPGSCFPCNSPRVTLHGSQLTKFRQDF